MRNALHTDAGAETLRRGVANDERLLELVLALKLLLGDVLKIVCWTHVHDLGLSGGINSVFLIFLLVLKALR